MPGRLELARRVGRMEQASSVRLVTLGDGAERGVRVLEFRAACGLSFDVIVDRAMDIGRCDYLGRSITWLSPAGLVGPWYAEPMELGWFRAWGGGLLTTCGLDHTLIGGVDDARHFRQAIRPNQEYGLHGRIGFQPARLTGYGERWEGEECVLWAEGVVRQGAVFAETLELRRTIEVHGTTIRVRDEVTNVGFHPTTHMFLYHMNLGYPLLDEGTELVLAAGPGSPVEPYPAEEYRVMSAPREGYPEQCWEHSIRPDADGRAAAALLNDRLGLGVFQRYDQRVLPFHTTWRMLGEGTYAVALEPSTNRDAGRFDAAQRGELQWLAPGENRRYELEIGVLDGAEQLTAYRTGLP